MVYGTLPANPRRRDNSNPVPSNSSLCSVIAPRFHRVAGPDTAMLPTGRPSKRRIGFAADETSATVSPTLIARPGRPGCLQLIAEPRFINLREPSTGSRGGCAARMASISCMGSEARMARPEAPANRGSLRPERSVAPDLVCPFLRQEHTRSLPTRSWTVTVSPIRVR